MVALDVVDVTSKDEERRDGEDGMVRGVDRCFEAQAAAPKCLGRLRRRVDPRASRVELEGRQLQRVDRQHLSVEAADPFVPRYLRSDLDVASGDDAVRGRREAPSRLDGREFLHVGSIAARRLGLSRRGLSLEIQLRDEVRLALVQVDRTFVDLEEGPRMRNFVHLFSGDDDFVGIRLDRPQVDGLRGGLVLRGEQTAVPLLLAKTIALQQVGDTLAEVAPRLFFLLRIRRGILFVLFVRRCCCWWWWCLASCFRSESTVRAARRSSSAS
mmetsp:Transcript_25629/g.83029  ORF Transcript_25629/g.83029 Transcript_25629/m.83029 type:complete len:270 (-) Transcript_25629:1244-2053(-)